MAEALPAPEPTRDPGAALETRLEFETLISDTSAALFSAPPESVERAVEHALDRVQSFFESDRCALLAVDTRRNSINVRLASYAPGVSPVSSSINLAEVYPWAARRVMVERLPVRVFRMSRLPPEADADRQAWEASGARSALVVPIEIGTELRHLMVVQTVGREWDWPDALVTRVRVLGELLAGALERSAMVAELREAEARVTVAADSADAGLWAMDSATGVFWASERAREIFGYAPDEAVTIERLRAMVYPDDWHVVREAIEGRGTGGDRVNLDYRIVLPDGRVRWVSSRGRRQLDASGQPIRITGATIDITERRETEEAFRRSEARLASGADLAGLAFYEVDFGGGAAYVDVRFREICGVPPEVRGLAAVDFWAEHLHPDDRARVLAVRERIHDGSVDEAAVEYRFLHPVRGERWIDHLAHVARRDATSRAVVTYGVLRDITDRKRADEERTDLSRRLIRAHEDERALLARELHDDVTQRLAVLAIEVGRAEAGPAGRAHAETLRAVREQLALLSEDVHSLAYHLHPSVLDELGLVEALRTTCDRFRSAGPVALSVDLDPVPADLDRDAALALFRVAQDRHPPRPGPVREHRAAAVAGRAPRRARRRRRVRSRPPSAEEPRARQHARADRAPERNVPDRERSGSRHHGRGLGARGRRGAVSPPRRPRVLHGPGEPRWRGEPGSAPGISPGVGGAHAWPAAGQSEAWHALRGGPIRHDQTPGCCPLLHAPEARFQP
jgi:PAS domain S-box-containing protein